MSCVRLSAFIWTRYRLFQDLGIKFAPLEQESYAENRTTVPTSKVLSYCTTKTQVVRNTQESRNVLILEGTADVQYWDGYAFTFIGLGFSAIAFFLWTKMKAM